MWIKHRPDYLNAYHFRELDSEDEQRSHIVVTVTAKSLWPPAQMDWLSNIKQYRCRHLLDLY